MDNKNEQQIGAATYVVERVFTKDTHQALVSQEQFDLAAHFMRRIDRPAYRIKAMPECENCHLRRTWLCCQGCMGYKMVEIEKMNAERGE